MKILKDGRYQIAAMIVFFLIAFAFNLKNPEYGLSSMPLVSKIFAALSALFLGYFLVKTWIIRK